MTFKRATFLTFISVFLFEGVKAQTEVYYNGVIGNKFKIGMTLSILGEKIIGEYSYRHHRNALLIEGTLKNAHLQLIEYRVQAANDTEFYDDGKVMTGTFEGTLAPDSTITGAWNNAQGTKHYPFTLIYERFDYLPDSILIRTEEVSCSCYEGQRIQIMDERISTVVFNRIVTSLNEDECPCEESSTGYVQGTVHNGIEIIYNKNNILNCNLNREAIGAHSYYEAHHLSFSLRTGEILYASDIFKPEYHSHVHALVLKEFEKQIKEGEKDSVHSSDLELAKETLEYQKTIPWGHYEFSLDDNKRKLILHVYDLWVGDDGHPFFSMPSFDVEITYDQLKPWVDPKGLFNFLLR